MQLHLGTLDAKLDRLLHGQRRLEAKVDHALRLLVGADAGKLQELADRLKQSEEALAASVAAAGADPTPPTGEQP